MSPLNHSYGHTCRLSRRPDVTRKGDDGPDLARAQFFYASPLPIDDPLSAVPTTSSDPKTAKHAPRPFSTYDNNALEEAWLAFGLAQHNKSRGNLSTSPTKASSALRTNLMNVNRGSKDTKRNERSEPSYAQDGRRFQDENMSHIRPVDKTYENDGHKLGKGNFPVLADNQSPRDPNPAVSGSLGFAEAGTTGFPFQRAPDRTENIEPFLSSPQLQTTSTAIEAEDGGTSPRENEDPESITANGDVQRCESTEHTENTVSIPVGISRLHLVQLPALQMMPIYWSPVHDIAAVTRGTWFYRDTMYPVESAIANQLEMGYRELRPWSQTWNDELESALALGVEGEEKITHRLWPSDDNRVNKSRFHCSTSPSNPRCAAMCFDGEVAAEGNVDLRQTNEKFPMTGETPRRFQNHHVIYKDFRNAYILKPSLQPSAYYGRKPLFKINKGIKVGIQVVRGFDWSLWEKIYPSRKSSSAVAAEKYASTSEASNASSEGICAACVASAAQPERPKVTDLVLVIHGIGQKLSERVESFHFTHAINSFRRSVNVELANESIKTVLRKDLGGIMVLPVNWRSNLTFEEGGPLKASDRGKEALQSSFSLRDITPDTIPTVRNLISDVMLDIPFYMSHHKPKMIEALVYEANRVYRLWCQNNEGFHQNGRVHIIAHSLGSAMALDILSRQPTLPQQIDLDSQKSAKYFDFDTKNLFFVGSPAGFFLLLERGKLMPRKGRNKPGADYGDGQDPNVVSDANNFGCLAVDNLYNVMHCNDPIAYRLNATVDPFYAQSLKNAQVPNATAGWFGTIGNAMKSLIPGASATPDLGVGQIAKPVIPRLPSQLEMDIHDFTREEIAEKKFFLLNDHGQIDYFLSSGSGPLEFQYLNMFSAHSSYWTSPDFIRMLVLEVGRKPGKFNTLPNMRAAKRVQR